MKWYDEDGRPNHKACGHIVGYRCACHAHDNIAPEEQDCVDYMQSSAGKKYVERLSENLD